MATREAAVVEGEYEVEEAGGGTAMAVVPRGVGIVARGTPGAGGLIRPVAKPAEVLAVQNETRALVHEALEEGRDFGTIPGTKKNSLYKAGAERVNAAFAVYPEFEVVEKEIDHDREVPWTKRGRGGSTYSGVSQGLYRYVLKCYLIHRESGAIIGTGVGACSTLESKYIDRPRDLENTVFKMAKKRAYVDATLTAYGLSDEFTQDVEDMDRSAFSGGSESDSGGAGVPTCPKCEGPMWDNRDRNDQKEAAGEKLAPDWKCKDKKCGGLYWRGQWPPQEEDEEEPSPEQRLIVQIENMIADIRKIDEARADKAFEFASKTIGDGKHPTVKDLQGCGGAVKAVLNKLKEEKGDSAEGNPTTSSSGRGASTSAGAPAPSTPTPPSPSGGVETHDELEQEMDDLFGEAGDPFGEG